MSTKYIVTMETAEGTEEVVASKSKKAQAVEIAEAGRKSTRRTHIVRTDKGTEVHVVKGVRKMKRTPRYSRTVDLPEGFQVPQGARPAYLRKRHDALIVAWDGEEGTEYGIQRLSTGELLEERFEKTRDAGKFVLTL